MKKIVERLYHKKISTLGIGVFRILYFSVLLFEVSTMDYYRALIFDPIPFIQPYEISFGPTFFIWKISLIMLICGMFVRYAAIINYILTVVVLGTITTFEYHMFYAYLGLNFIAIFLPLGHSLSVDNLLRRKQGISVSQRTSVLSYYLPMALIVGFFYFDSILFKFSSSIWLNGLGVWLPSSIPHVTQFQDQWLLNQKWPMYFMGYLTMLFELAFVFLIWFKRWRIILLLTGIVLHIGILIEFPIPYFALAMTSTYALLVPVGIWKILLKKMGVKFAKTASNIPTSQNLISEQNKIKLITWSIVLAILLQVNISYNSGIFGNTRQTILSWNIRPLIWGVTASDKTRLFTKAFFGMTGHPLFMDFHFDEYNHIVALTYVSENGEEQWLPIIDEKGMPDSYLIGFNWAKWSFRTNSPKIDEKRLQQGIERFTAFWAKQENISLDKASFRIKVKKIESASGWKENYLIDQINQPWQDAGMAEWTDKQFSIKLKNIEAI